MMFKAMAAFIRAYFQENQVSVLEPGLKVCIFILCCCNVEASFAKNSSSRPVVRISISHKLHVIVGYSYSKGLELGD